MACRLQRRQGGDSLVLLATTDYPPMVGGIQLLLSRLVQHSRLPYKILTFAPEARLERGTMAPAIRIWHSKSHRAAVAALNAATLWHALRLRPSAILSGHLTTAPAALLLGRLLSVPTIQYLYAKELGHRPRLAHFVISRASASIAISSHTYRQALLLGAPSERLHLVQPGVDRPQPRSPSAPRPSRQDTRPTIITVARLEDRYKGFDMVMRALPVIRERLPDVRWLVIGDGSLRTELEHMATELGVAGSVEFLGAVDDPTRDEWLEKADAFVMPGRLMPDGIAGEGFGIVYLEAGMHGLPCVAGNVGGAVDAVQDGETGILVDPTDNVAIAAAVCKLLTNPQLAMKMGAAGRERAMTQSWQHMADRVDELTERLVIQHHKSRHA